eukprot:g6511.t1
MEGSDNLDTFQQLKLRAKSSPAEFDGRYVAKVSVGTHYKPGSKACATIECNLIFFREGRVYHLRNYGDRITLKKKDLLALGGITDETVRAVVRKMRSLDARQFTGIRPRYYKTFMAMSPDPSGTATAKTAAT